MTSVEETAYHEAGHFVIGHVLGLDQEAVTIEPNKDSLGHVLAEDYSTWVGPDGTTHGDAAGGIVAFYAGLAAQLRFAADSRDRFGARSDDAKAERLLRLLTGSDAERQALEQELRQKADQMVAEHWTEIEALAAELVKAKTISASAAQLIMEVARGEADPSLVAEYRQWPGLDK